MRIWSCLWIVVGLVAGVTPSVSAQTLTDIDGAARRVFVAAPLGLLEFCDAEPAHCAAPGQSRSQVADAVRQARRIAWSERFAGGPGAAPGAIAGEPLTSRVGGPASGSAKFLGGGAPPVAPSLAVTERQIADLNTTINRAVRPVSDQRQYGRPDVWTLPTVSFDGRLAGDCEDIVLAKRSALIQAGVDPSHLSIALAVTASGDDHAVLLIARPDGDFVLDNLDGRVRHWSEVDLHWQARQVSGRLLTWIRL